MRILLITNASYLPTYGGATRCNRVWLESMAQHGHECMVLSPQPVARTAERRLCVRQELQAEGVYDSTEGETRFPKAWNGVTLFLLSTFHALIKAVPETIRLTAPDYVLVSSEDFAQKLLRVAIDCNSTTRTIYLAHTPQMVPFGPEAIHQNLLGAAAIKASAGIISISHFMRLYFERFLGRSTHVVFPPVSAISLQSEPMQPHSGNFVTMINPCSVKGISIFLEIIRQYENAAYAALPGWGTTSSDLIKLNSSGVTLLAPCKDMDKVWRNTRLLVVPSLWAEGFGMVVLEAMMRGIPVLSSDQGGLTEAKLGTDYIFSVNPIRNYSMLLDERGLPLPEIPQQELQPWLRAIETLLTDDIEYVKASTRAKTAADHFLAAFNDNAFEHLLLSGF